MKRILLEERPDWKKQAEDLGFIFHTMYGEPYWDESRAYVFTLKQIEEDLEDVSAELYGCCLELVDRVIDSEEVLKKLAIPEIYWDWIRNSWKESEPSLYGRFDLLYDGQGPAKLLEFNADTPTALYETGFFQWNWFEEQKARGIISEGSDQFNSVQDKLIARLGKMFAPGCHVHFASCKGSDEDRATVKYLQDCATQAGLISHFLFVEDIGADAEGRFADNDEFIIDNLFKLYPYEDMLREEYGPLLPRSPIKLIEPPWKAILSNKGILPLLWEMFPDHPNLLPSTFESDNQPPPPDMSYVKKPLFSREGANVEIYHPDQPPEVSPGHYGEEGTILQAFHPVPKFENDYTVIGSWIVGDEPAGIGIREDSSQITRDLSRFVPHLIVD
ncbi:MAG: glutathionylspermidine synthase family protein [Stappiaceae bacterium]